MNATPLSSTPGGAPASLGTIALRTPDPTRPGVFRVIRYLRFATGQGAEELLVDSASCTLAASFQIDSYNAVPASAGPLRAQLDESDDGMGVVVTLDSPRRVRGLTVSGYSSTSTLEVYRLDGDTPSQDPTVTAAGSTIGHHHIHLPGVAIAGDEGHARGRRAARSDSSDDGEMMAAASASDSSDSGGVVVMAELMPTNNISFSFDFTDRRFLVRIRESDHDLASLSPSDIGSLSVDSYPRNPRLGISFPAPGAPGAVGDPAAASFFWRADGEIGNDAPISAGVVAAGTEFGQELGRAATRFVDLLRTGAADDVPHPTLPATIDVPLVIESDAPCIFDLDAFAVSYQLARESFAGGEEKQVLRFAANIAESQELAVDVPAGIDVQSATISLVESLRGDRSALTGGGELRSEPSSRTGIRVNAERRAAQKFTPAKAMTASGALVALLPLSTEATATLELREDAAGEPTGRALGQGAVVLAAPGRPGWGVVRFAEPIILTAQPHWLVLSCDAGTLVWLTAEADDAVHLLERRGASDWAIAHAVRDVSAHHSILSLGGSAAADTPRLDISIGAHALASGDAAGDRSVFDLGPALTAFLTGAPATTGLLPIPLRFAALGPGSITVYPPRVVYDL